MDAVGDFFDRLTSVEWMADTGLPLLVALGGLWVAVRLVGRQIANDRRLRDADRVMQQLRGLTAQLQAAADHIRDEPLESEYWRAEDWPDAAAVADAIRRSIPYQSPAARDQALATSARLAASWRDIQSVANDPSPPVGAQPSPLVHATAMRGALAPFAVALARLGQAIESWDGETAQPTLATSHLRALDYTTMDYVDDYIARLEPETEE